MGSDFRQSTLDAGTGEPGAALIFLPAVMNAGFCRLGTVTDAFGIPHYVKLSREQTQQWSCLPSMNCERTADLQRDLGRMKQRVMNQAVVDRVLHTFTVLVTEIARNINLNPKVVHTRRRVFDFVSRDPNPCSGSGKFVFPEVLRGVVAGTGAE